MYKLLQVCYESIHFDFPPDNFRDSQLQELKFKQIYAILTFTHLFNSERSLVTYIKSKKQYQITDTLIFIDSNNKRTVITQIIQLLIQIKRQLSPRESRPNDDTLRRHAESPCQQVENANKAKFKSAISNQSSFLDKDGNQDSLGMHCEGRHIKKKYFFKDLLNQMPDGNKNLIDFILKGVCIISKDDQVQYSNITFLEMVNINKKTQVKEALSKLINCYKLFEEQTMFNLLFEMLNNKLINSQGNQIEIQNDPYVNGSYESKSETALHELQNILQNMSSKIEQKQFVSKQKSLLIEFQYEVKMYCQPNETIKGKKDKPLYQLMFKPFVRKDKAHILLIIKDVTLFNEISALENINSNKSKMLAQVAHEFRTPLNGIIIMTEDRMEISDDIWKKEYLQPVLSSSKWLLCLVNDILDLAQLNAGKFKLVIKYFDVGQLLIEVVSMMIVQTNFKGIQLDLLIPKDFPQFISSDPNRIKQILINLLSNAIKFTSKGGKITIGAEYNQYEIQFYVSDTGVGIDKEDQGKLFKAFGKIDKTSNLNSQGVGLGLMICNILAIKLFQREQCSPLNENNVQGLTVYSEGKGMGSRFSFKIFDHSEVQSSGQDFSGQSKINIQSSHYQSGFSLNSQKQMQSEKKNYRETKGNQIIIKSSLIISGNRKRSSKIRMTQIINNNQREVLYRFEVEQQKLSNAPQVKIEEFNVNPVNQSVQMSEQSFENQEVPQEGQFTFSNFVPQKAYKILIVDDISTNIIPLKRFLERKGLTCQEAFSGIEALETIEQSPDSFRVILMDVEMPIMDGLETVKQIRIRFKSQEYYIIGCSGYSDDKEKQNCLNAGMNDYIEKPVQVQNLYERIQKIIH